MLQKYQLFEESPPNTIMCRFTTQRYSFDHVSIYIYKHIYLYKHINIYLDRSSQLSIIAIYQTVYPSIYLSSYLSIFLFLLPFFIPAFLPFFLSFNISFFLSFLLSYSIFLSLSPLPITFSSISEYLYLSL